MQETLFQRLNPDVTKTIYDDQAEYPSLVGCIMNELKGEVGIGWLTLRTSLLIFTYAFGYTETFNESKFNKLFR